MSYVRRFKYKEIDRFTILPEKLSKTIDKYQHLGYFVEVFPQIWQSAAGFYNTEYVIKILKVEEMEE